MAQHLVQFYAHDDSLTGRLIEFITQGFAANTLCIVIGKPGTRQRIEQWISEESGLDGSAEEGSIRKLYVALDARDTLDRILINDWPSERLFDNVIGTLINEHTQQSRVPVRAFGEMVGLLCDEGKYAAALRLEALWNELLQREPLTLLCGYPMHLFSDHDKTDQFHAICGAHSHVLEEADTDAASRSQQRLVAQLRQQAAALQQEVARREAVERTLTGKIEELADADRRKDQLLAVLGHELRNPLAPIVSSLELLKLRGEDPDIRLQVCDNMERQLTIAKRLIDDLIDVSRIKRNKLPLNGARVALLPIIERAINNVLPLLERKQQRLRKILPDEECFVYADAERLTQALGNILQNAVKYTPSDGRIVLQLRHIDNALELSIRDNGIGLNEEQKTAIFDSFMQGASELREGLGLGLTIAKNIVELHHGSIAVHSSGIGAGSEFIVRLPRMNIAQSANDATRPTLNTKHFPIMVVDDNIDAATSLGQLLTLLGHDVRTCFHANDALQTITTFSPALIFVDIQMPQVNGYQLAKMLRRRLGEKPTLVALTGYGQTNDKLAALEAGFDHHCVKPIELAKIQQLLHGEAIVA